MSGTERGSVSVHALRHLARHGHSQGVEARRSLDRFCLNEGRSRMLITAICWPAALLLTLHVRTLSINNESGIFIWNSFEKFRLSASTKNIKASPDSCNVPENRYTKHPFPMHNIF